MKSYNRELWLNVEKRMDFINITPEVEQAVIESGINEGLCLVNAMHITASVFINDDEQGLHRDYKSWLEKLAPHEPLSRYDHNLTGEDNGDAHHKRQIMGREVDFIIYFHHLFQLYFFFYNYFLTKKDIWLKLHHH